MCMKAGDPSLHTAKGSRLALMYSRVNLRQRRCALSLGGDGGAGGGGACTSTACGCLAPVRANAKSDKLHSARTMTSMRARRVSISFW